MTLNSGPLKDLVLQVVYAFHQTANTTSDAQIRILAAQARDSFQRYITYAPPQFGELPSELLGSLRYQANGIENSLQSGDWRDAFHIAREFHAGLPGDPGSDPKTPPPPLPF